MLLTYSCIDFYSKKVLVLIILLVVLAKILLCNGKLRIDSLLGEVDLHFPHIIANFLCFAIVGPF